MDAALERFAIYLNIVISTDQYIFTTGIRLSNQQLTTEHFKARPVKSLNVQCSGQSRGLY